MNSTPSISELFPSTAPASDVRAPSELGQEEFMELMVAQLENQDPTKPMDNFEFLSQIAQFGTVNGIQGLQEGFDSLAGMLQANQTLPAASLVGSKVMTESNLGVLQSEESLGATIDLRGNASEVGLYVQDMAGRLVHSRTLGPAAAGELQVSWDGTTDDGSAALPGQYRISAEAVIDGQVQAVSVYTHSEVKSVTIDPGNAGVRLGLDGGDEVQLSAVKSFL